MVYPDISLVPQLSISVLSSRGCFAYTVVVEEHQLDKDDLEEDEEIFGGIEDYSEFSDLIDYYDQELDNVFKFIFYEEVEDPEITLFGVEQEVLLFKSLWIYTIGMLSCQADDSVFVASVFVTDRMPAADSFRFVSLWFYATEKLSCQADDLVFVASVFVIDRMPAADSFRFVSLQTYTIDVLVFIIGI
ncbi:MAG: hypothetical protein EZS28_037393 [Streblomastix strix]|uniref:Uncharacterized protein n=1 Tax=Streblomastix strix TaxID=222440 RepID=A0A5J4U9G4_9EUKA|nr:MAG: hypothetical protein EZS28_037393 [Streblomastix strix]